MCVYTYSHNGRPLVDSVLLKMLGRTFLRPPKKVKENFQSQIINFFVCLVCGANSVKVPMWVTANGNK
jgi:hypothetical protein